MAFRIYIANQLSTTGVVWPTPPLIHHIHVDPYQYEKRAGGGGGGGGGDPGNEAISIAFFPGSTTQCCFVRRKALSSNVHG